MKSIAIDKEGDKRINTMNKIMSDVEVLSMPGKKYNAKMIYEALPQVFENSKKEILTGLEIKNGLNEELRLLVEEAEGSFTGAIYNNYKENEDGLMIKKISDSKNLCLITSDTGKKFKLIDVTN
ncbi:hypothetical protein [Vagococcus carniphilus]|uniref:hypothetical protein n=1 Tax=Vagococcus carniphilus TaxID=218144 RepID=UPI003BACAB31